MKVDPLAADFAAVYASVPAARRWAAGTLVGWGVSAVGVSDAVLVLTELATNAIDHAADAFDARFTVRLRQEDDATLCLEVTDGGGDGRRVVGAGAHRASFLAHFADAWWIDDDPSGQSRTVCAQISTGADAEQALEDCPEPAEYVAATAPMPVIEEVA